ncbi:PEBP (phosphatidylethanolamine-binding protein) family protein [Raphanus sativus]|nr:PEBP (phosphatidylethanolamine-binding protein) family protein [Raphanus sativus]
MHITIITVHPYPHHSHRLLPSKFSNLNTTKSISSLTFHYNSITTLRLREHIKGKYTKGGQGVKKNISPPLEWYNVPQGTKSLALVVEDIDAPDPSGPLVPWTIWVVVDIPPDMKGLPEGFSGNDEQDVAGIREGNNDHKIPGWRGPLMPSHDHRFQFKLFALSDKPNLGHTVTKERLLDAVDGIVIREAVLTCFV